MDIRVLCLNFGQFSRIWEPKPNFDLDQPHSFLEPSSSCTITCTKHPKKSHCLMHPMMEEQKGLVRLPEFRCISVSWYHGISVYPHTIFSAGSCHPVLSRLKSSCPVWIFRPPHCLIDLLLVTNVHAREFGGNERIHILNCLQPWQMIYLASIVWLLLSNVFVIFVNLPWTVDYLKVNRMRKKLYIFLHGWDDDVSIWLPQCKRH